MTLAMRAWVIFCSVSTELLFYTLLPINYPHTTWTLHVYQCLRVPCCPGRTHGADVDGGPARNVHMLPTRSLVSEKERACVQSVICLQHTRDRIGSKASQPSGFVFDFSSRRSVTALISPRSSVCPGTLTPCTEAGQKSASSLSQTDVHTTRAQYRGT